MEHPPIPPNFKLVRGVNELYPNDYYWENPDDDRLCFSERSPYERWVVACCMRCAWLDEASKTHHRADSLSVRMFPVNRDGPTLEECREHTRVCEETKAAIENAEAWCKWGRGEEWK